MPEEQKISYYLKKSKILKNNFKKKIRISILSSFTLNGIEEIFQVKCDEKNKLLSCIIFHTLFLIIPFSAFLLKYLALSKIQQSPLSY